MSQTILSGDFTVYFTNDTGGDKQVRWTGSATGTRTVNELYSALEDLFDDNTGGVGDYMDEGVPMKGITPVEYQIGRIETNDGEPWFIDPDTITHLTGGALTTTGWSRTVGTATGIVKVAYTTGTDFIAADLGKTVTTTTDGDSGTLLYFDGSTAWIRPDDNTIGNSFDATTASDTITVTAGSAASVTQSSASTTGEMIWSNIYTLGSVQANTRLYVAQNNSVITNWWGDGQFDILVLTTDQGSLIDYGFLTIYARQGTKLYDHFIIDVSLGGRNAVPLATSSDNNNQNGYRTLNVSSATIEFTEGGIVTGGTSGAEGIVTKNTGNPATSIEYYLIGDLTDFTSGEALTDQETFTVNGNVSGSPSNANGSTYTDVTITFGWNNTFDIDADSINENYSIVIDCNSRPLSQVYERLKYITRRGETSLLNGIEGQQYIGPDHMLRYNTLTGTISPGDTVTQETGAATGVFTIGEVVAHDTTNKHLIIRDTRGDGTWRTGLSEQNLEVDGSNYVTMTLFGTNDIINAVTPSKVAPFGTLAGGRFFGAFGVVLDNVATSDVNNYEVIDNYGDTYAEPIQVATVITVVDAATQLPIENARVIIGASDGTGDLGYQDSVTITRSGSTATVSHTGHPYVVGSKVNIVGDLTTENEYTGAKTITAVTANSYDFTVAGTPTTPASGTITSTGLILEGLTDSNGQISDVRSISLDQPIIGRARKSSASPLYKSSTISGVIDSVTGYSQTVSLILDE